MERATRLPPRHNLMADVTRLKKKAAEYEAKRQYERAAGVYEQITRSIGSGFRDTDIPLFNRLGDLYLRIGDVERGVTMHEKAVDMYAELGFFNNAIALCNKILRQSPDRASIYYKLGKISAKKGFISDAKQNFLEYSARMQKSDRMDEAFRALKEFADLCPGQDDVRLMLAEQLGRAGRPAEALEQLQLLHEQLVGEGRDAEAGAAADRIRAIDPNAVPRRPSGPVRRMAEDLIFLDVNAIEPPAHTTPVEGLIPTSLVEEPSTGDVKVLTPQEFGAIQLPPAAEAEQREREFHRPQSILAGLPLIEDYDPRYLEEAEISKVQAEEFEVGEEEPESAPLEQTVDDSGSDEAVHSADPAGEAQAYSGADTVWPVAEPTSYEGSINAQAEELEAAAPADPAFSWGELAPAASEDASIAHDDAAGPAAADEPAHYVEPPPAAEPARPDDSYVDLGEWLRETQTPRSTRMIADGGEIPPEGEQADFEEMLAKFKEGIAQSMDADDFGSHYDLGIAFREMGLLDEAIAEFQKALRGREHRVATYEALGHCFVDKRQYEVAVTVLQRALREPGFEDERGMGVLYLLGYANERMVRYAEAARYYQRVFSVDINFRDISARMSAVAQAAG
jgi:tetratricopeptide (TPR) repeat protein